ncbi:hypothetical protein HK096_000293, partial [Nowakowskiella sp. JEL0078]
GHIIADAGYPLLKHVIVPYDIDLNMPSDEKRYNYIHSTTRIIVEHGIGKYKGRSRIFKRPLDMKGTVHFANGVSLNA